MSLQCQKIEIKKLPFYASDITNFTSAVCAVVTEMSSFGEPIFESWAATYSGDLYDTFTTVSTYSSFWQQTDDNNVNTFVYSNSANILQSNSVVNNTSGNWNSVYNSYNSSSASFLTNSSADIRYVKLSGDVMTGGLSSPSLSTNNLYVAGSTINFFDETGSVIETLKSSDVGNFKSNYTLTNSHSGIWDQVYSDFSTQSGNNTSVYNTVQTNSGNWNYQGSDIKSLTSNWENTYIGFSTQSGNNTSVYNSFNSNSSNYDSVYNSVQSNSATNWNYQGNDIKSLTANWQASYTALTSSSANWNDTRNTVQTNSATLWNYQGSDIKSLTGNWENTYSIVSSSSANWNNVYSVVQTNSSQWAIDTSVDTGVRALTSNWENTYVDFSSQSANNLSVYNSFNSNSSNYDSVYNSVNSNSATNWNYQGTDLKNLSSNWEDTYNTVQDYSALWIIDNSIDIGVRALTSNWENTYTNFSVQSGNNINVYNTVNSNSALWIGGGGGDIEVNSFVYTNSANILQVDTNVNNNSGNWNYSYHTILTGGTVGGNVSVSGNLSAWTADVNYIDFNSTIDAPLYQEGRLFYDNVDNTLSLYVDNPEVTLNIGQELWVLGVNKTGSVIPNATVVYLSGAQGNRPKMWPALADSDLGSADTIGLTTHEVAINAEGYITTEGIVSNINTSSFVEGQVLYLSPTIPGGITNVKPVAPQHLVKIGYALNAINNGKIFVTIDNGYELDELHNVKITNVQNADILKYNSTSSIWVNGSEYNGSDVKSLTGNWENTYTNFSIQSANNLSVYNSVNSNSATTWNYQGTDIKSLTSNWQSTYSTVNITSANWNSVYSSFNSQSANNSSVFSTVQTNSATTWNYQGTDIKSLTSNWQNTYTNFSIQSANNISTYSTVQVNSASWGTGGGSGVDTEVRALTGNWQSTYSTVQANSSTWGTGGGGGGGLPLASYSRWQLVGAESTTVYSISGATMTAPEAYRVTINAIIQDPVIYTIDAVADTITFSSVPPLSSDIIVIENKIIGSDVTSLTANWENTSSVVQTNSASWAGAGGSTNIWIPAAAWIPRTTSGCGVDSRELATNRQNFDELLFDAASNEFAQALTILPNNYNNGTITSRFYWTASTGSGDVVWGVQGRAFANDDALDSAFGTAQTVTDSLLTINDMHVSDATAAVTFAGTPAANTPIQLQIYRDAAAGGDTMANDARLLGVEIIYTTA